MDWLKLLEVAGAVATPVVGAYIAYVATKVGAAAKERQWRNQAVIEKRLEFYDEAAPKLNSLFCYYLHVGEWKELSPPEVIALKRKLDKAFHVYRHIFDAEVFDRYTDYITLLFQEHGPWGTDARMKTGFEDRRDHTRVEEWDFDWNEMFLPDAQPSKADIADRYNAVMTALRRGLKLQEDAEK